MAFSTNSLPLGPFTLREMTLKDLEQVHEWRNHLLVRSNSADHRAIEWDEHLDWFKTNPSLKTVFVEGDKLVGVVTLTTRHFWSFYLDPNLPERSGYGTIMLTMFLLVYGKQPIQARVLASNIASLKLHRKFGFTVFSKKTPGLIEFRRNW